MMKPFGLKKTLMSEGHHVHNALNSSTLEEGEELESIDDITKESLPIEISIWGTVEDLQK